MCIFTKETITSNTIILTGPATDTTHFIAYQNKVITLEAGKTIMMLPIPTKSNIKLHDTREFGGFLSDIGSLIYSHQQFRGMGGNSKGFERVGSYQFKTVKPEDVKREITEIHTDWYDNIPRWVDGFLAKYDGWNWLFCIVDEGTDMTSEPILMEYEPLVYHKYFIPMMDVHGDEPLSNMVKYDHIIGISHPNVKHGFPHQYPTNFPFDMSNHNINGIVVRWQSYNGDVYTDFGWWSDLPHSLVKKFDNRYED